MEDKTKYRFADSIKELMNNTPLDKITVKDIVEGCGLTRQTFYRNFQDKYDLVNWYFEKLAEKSFKKMGSELTLREGLIKKLSFIQEEHVFFSQAFQSHDHNSLIAYDYDSIFEFYENVIRKKTGGPLSEDICFLLEMYCQGSVNMTVDWVTGGMKLPVEKIVDLLLEAMPRRLEELLVDLE